jgi:hypothetical protein
LTAPGKGLVLDLLKILYDWNLVSGEYNWDTNNYKRFAAYVFDATNNDGRVYSLGAFGDLPD